MLLSIRSQINEVEVINIFKRYSDKKTERSHLAHSWSGKQNIKDLEMDKYIIIAFPLKNLEMDKYIIITFQLKNLEMDKYIIITSQLKNLEWINTL